MTQRETKTIPTSIHGVQLKHFEQVVAQLLQQVEPHYEPLPPPLTTTSLWAQLPPSARIHGHHPGQLSSKSRALRKQGQLDSLWRCLPRNPTASTPQVMVDWGGGSGHLAIPLALMYPHNYMIVVDFNQVSLRLMQEKSKRVVEELRENDHDIQLSTLPLPKEYAQDPFSPTAIPNLYAFAGPVEDWSCPVDISIALHLCGQATDVSIHKAVQYKASCLLLAPCCVGKLSPRVRNPDIYHATGQNQATIQYPQSKLFCQVLRNDESDDPITSTNSNSRNDWNALAKAADYSNLEEALTPRNATRRIAKALLETDRRLVLESYGYRTKLMRMDPWNVTPKNDILAAYYESGRTETSIASATSSSASAIHSNLTGTRDLVAAKKHLFGTAPTAAKSSSSVLNDWTTHEEEEIRGILEEQVVQSSKKEDNAPFLFPTQMGKRKRKLIHYVASQLQLAHWSVGQKDREKTVAVAKRRHRD